MYEEPTAADKAPTRLFIDGEWNGFSGDLISIALVSATGDEFYEVLELEQEPDPWVAEHVLPKLGKAPVDYVEFREKMAAFLRQFDAVHIVADWPEDIAWFCSVLVTGPGTRLDTPPLTMEVLRIDPVSTNPHNALADAWALREAVMFG